MNKVKHSHSIIELIIAAAIGIIITTVLMDILSVNRSSTEISIEGEEINPNYSPELSSAPVSSNNKESSLPLPEEFSELYPDTGNTVISQENGMQIIRHGSNQINTQIVQTEGGQTILITENGRTTSIMQDKHGTIIEHN